MNIKPRTDVSFLFSGLGSGAANVAGSNFLSDYAAIKNGSYGKLMKAYYSETGNASVNKLVKNSSKNSQSAEDAKVLTKIQSSTDSLKESADELLVTGDKSVFAIKDITTKDENGKETTEKGYDTATIYKAVSKFVDDYNDVMKAVDETESKAIVDRTATMGNASVQNMKKLSEIGITVEEDGTLSIDKKAFEKADMSKVKNLFNKAGSYGYTVSAQASMINFAADQAATKASTYTGNGTYGNAYNTGNIFNTYF